MGDREPRWVPRYPDRDPAKDRKPHAAPRHLDMDAAKDREALAAPRHSDRDPAKDRERSAGHSMNSFNQTRLWPGVAEVRGTCPDYQSLDRALSTVEICGVMAKRKK